MLTSGIEPETSRLLSVRSTNWAMPALSLLEKERKNDVEFLALFVKNSEIYKQFGLVGSRTPTFPVVRQDCATITPPDQNKYIKNSC